MEDSSKILVHQKSNQNGQQEEYDFDNEINIPQEPEIRESIIQLRQLMTEKRYPEAEQMLNTMIEQKKSEASLYYYRAEVFMKQNKFLQSLKDMNQAIRLEPVKQCAKSSEHHYLIKKTLMQMSNDI